MTTLPDLIFVAVFAVAGPLTDYLVFWPAFQRLSRADPAWARKWLWKSGIGHLWLMVAIGLALWLASGRSWADLGFIVPAGRGLWISLALFLLLAAYNLSAIASLARSAEVRAGLRQQFQGVEAVLPRTRDELCWFGGLSLTAGFCEEFLYRGFFIVALAPWFGWWGAAALSLALFAVAHLYQGWGGVLKTGIVGILFTAAVAVSGSLWPAIAMHALIDLGAGVMAWLALREEG
jgi:membrane protease YdiL (CAAX protease family)